MKRILIVMVNWLGDAVMATPALPALKKSYPDSYVAVMGARRVRDVFMGNPHIDEFIEFDERAGQKGMLEKFMFIRSLRARKFDTVFLIHRSFTRALICLLAGIPRRIGWKRLKTSWVVNHPVAIPQGPIHRQDYYLHLFERAGLAIPHRSPEVFVSTPERDAAKRFFSALPSERSFLVGMHAGANWAPKRWPIECFAELCDRLNRELGYTIVFTGSEDDRAIVINIMTRMRVPALNLCGKTSLRELAAVMTRLDVFVSNDSGPAHLAASLRVPTIVIFGPTSPAITAPRGRLVIALAGTSECHIPCYRSDCADNHCMELVSVEDVYTKISGLHAQS